LSGLSSKCRSKSKFGRPYRMLVHFHMKLLAEACQQLLLLLQHFCV